MLRGAPLRTLFAASATSLRSYSQFQRPPCQSSKYRSQQGKRFAVDACAVLHNRGVASTSRSGDANNLLGTEQATAEVPASTSAVHAAAAGSSEQISSRGSSLKHYMTLSKARLTAFVASTAGAGYFLAPTVAGAGLSPSIAVPALIVGTTLCSASANSLNQIMEKDYDALMKRTQGRPLPSGAMSVADAKKFAAATAVSGTALLGLCGPIPAALGAANIALYAGIYTPMKRWSVWNTWVGAVVGAVPPMMGWAAATGGVELGGVVMAAILFHWQLPHFMSLAYLARQDYAAGGYKMLPTSDPEKARRVSLRHTAALIPLMAAVPFVCADSAVSHPMIVSSAAMLGVSAFSALWLKAALQKPVNVDWARRVFRYSLLFIPALFAASGIWWLESKYRSSLLGEECPHPSVTVAKHHKQQQQA